ncbi:hypothetical protein N9891_00585 [bacterium]|nr:hypothetical protein [bacterium]
MNRVLSFLALLALFFPACREGQIAEPVAYESTSVVQVHESLLSGSIDWNRQLQILASEEVLAAAASAAGTDPQTLAKATRSEVKIEDQTIHIIAIDPDADLAKTYAECLAESFIDFSISAEVKLANEKLDQLDRELLEQAEEAERSREELSQLIQEYGIPYFDKKEEQGADDPDRMTYEKAKKALEEDPE